VREHLGTVRCRADVSSAEAGRAREQAVWFRRDAAQKTGGAMAATGWRPSRPSVVRSTWRQARTASARAVVKTAKQGHAPGAATSSRAPEQPLVPRAKQPCPPAQRP
jgi:hypothetical protein